jgi:hypothetical protein
VNLLCCGPTFSVHFKNCPLNIFFEKVCPFGAHQAYLCNKKMAIIAIFIISGGAKE